MPVFNAASYVQQAIDSILNQTYTHWEFIILDDGSTDDTVAIIENYADKRIHLIKSTSNKGSLIQRNELLKRANGDYIVWQDADDIAHQQRIELQVAMLQSHPELGIVGTQVININKAGKQIGETSYSHSHTALVQDIDNRVPFAFATTMIKKEVYQKIGGFRVYFKDKSFYDYDWIVRILEAYQGATVQQYLYYRRILNLSNSSTIGAVEKHFGDEIVRFLRAERIKHGVDSLQRSPTSAFRDFIAKRKQYFSVQTNVNLKRIQGYISHGSFSIAAKLALENILIAPTKLYHYRTLKYVLMQWFKSLL